MEWQDILNEGWHLNVSHHILVPIDEEILEVDHTLREVKAIIPILLNFLNVLKNLLHLVTRLFGSAPSVVASLRLFGVVNKIFLVLPSNISRPFCSSVSDYDWQRLSEVLIKDCCVHVLNVKLVCT